jgi:hypothetical protein
MYLRPARCRLMAEELPRPAVGFLIKTELRMTPDKGIGVFATQFIPANTRIYVSDPQSYTEEEASAYLESLPTLEERQDWLDHAYGSKGKICQDLYDTVRINHSDNPTMFNKSETEKSLKNFAIATRDIQVGEELTEDYKVYTLTQAYIRLCKQYGICEVYEKESYSK